MILRKIQIIKGEKKEEMRKKRTAKSCAEKYNDRGIVGKIFHFCGVISSNYPEHIIRFLSFMKLSDVEPINQTITLAMN